MLVERQLCSSGCRETAGRRTRRRLPVGQCSRQPRFERIAEGMAVVVRNGTSGGDGTHACDGVGGRKTIRVVAEALRVFAFELDAEICRAAVVLRIKTVRFATRRRPDLDNVDIDPLQRIDDRLARRARVRARQHEYARQIQRRQRLSRGRRKAAGRRIKRYRRQRISGDRIGRGVFGVEGRRFERFA